MKKIKVENYSVPERKRNIDELNSKKKLIAKLNHDCIAKVLMYLTVLEKLEMEKGKSSFINCLFTNRIFL